MNWRAVKVVVPDRNNRTNLNLLAEFVMAVLFAIVLCSQTVYARQSSPAQAASLREEARASIANGQWDAAIQSYEKAIALAPNELKLRLELGAPTRAGSLIRGRATSRDRRSQATLLLGHLIEAVEGPITLNLCVDGAVSCDLQPSCRMYRVWEQGQRVLLDVFAHTNLSEVASSRPRNTPFVPSVRGATAPPTDSGRASQTPPPPADPAT